MFPLFARFDAVVGWLGLIRLISSLGFSLAMPFMGIFLHEELKVTMTQIGLMLAASGILGALSSTIAGAASDVIGRRRLAIILLASRSLSFALLGLLVYYHASFLIFGFVFVVSAVLGNPLFTVTDAMVADVTSADRRNEVYGAMRVAVNLGWAIGPAIGGIMVATGYHWLFFFTAIALLASTALMSWKVRETWAPNPARESGLDLLSLGRDGQLLRFLGVGLIFLLVQGQFVTPVSVHASEHVKLTKEQIGMLYFLNGGLVVLLQLTVTRLTSRFHPLAALTAAALIYAVGYYFVGLAGSFALMLGAIVVVTMGEMVGAPTATAYVSRLAPAGKVGGYMGAFGMVVHLGWTVGPLVGGVLMDLLPRPVMVWQSIAALAVCAAIGFILLYRRERVVG